MYDDISQDLEKAYDRNAPEREASEISIWKQDLRQHFLTLLQKEKKTKLLEIGAGPGHFGKFFQDNGLDVICTDLSPEMVRLCRAKGLTAYVRDFLNLDFPESSFDALFALNCLLHVPKQTLPEVLGNLQRLLKPGGLFFYGVYGGIDFEGIREQDPQRPKRFFSFHTDTGIREIVGEYFELVEFQIVPLENRSDRIHFQAMIWRRQKR